MEYEYSFNVKDLKAYINYCVKNNYEMKDSNRQVRTIYRNNGNIARITEDYKNNEVLYSLDFKEDKLDNNDLIIRKESKKIIFNNIKNCEDILSFLDYKKDNTLDRERTIYNKGNVKFEIDKYEKPFKTFVVAIEGKKEDVDNVYKELEAINKKYKI